MEDKNSILKKELADIDSRIATLNKNIQLGKDLESLHEDERFQRVILGAYQDEEAERIFGVLVDPTHQLKRDVMENLMDKLGAIRSQKQFFGTTLMNAHMAVEGIEEEEKYRREVNAESNIIDVIEE